MKEWTDWQDMCKYPEAYEFKTNWKGFVEWHNERTVNNIENPEECQCSLKSEWRHRKIRENQQ